MKIDLLAVPWDSGQRAHRMGAGPLAILHAGLQHVLEQQGHTVTTEEIEPAAPVMGEVATAFQLATSLAQRVRASRNEDALPLVLSGNCATALGTVAGIGARDVAIVWFDAHGDFNTPETTRSGFFDGMALATLAGRCWREVAATVPGFVPVPEPRIALVGARDLDPAEDALLAEAAVRRVGADSIRAEGAAALEAVLDALARDVAGAYVHVDLDVLDPAEGVANSYAAPGGLALDRLIDCIARIGERLPIRAAALTAFDPAAAADDRMLRAALRVAAAIVAAVR